MARLDAELNAKLQVRLRMDVRCIAPNLMMTRLLSRRSATPLLPSTNNEYDSMFDSSAGWRHPGLVDKRTRFG
jgi:hypothetical protein